MLTREELTEPELAVLDAVESGTLVELPLGTPMPADPAQGGTWGEEREIRAQLLDELLTGGPGMDVRPRAVRVAGAPSLGGWTSKPRNCSAPYSSSTAGSTSQ